MTNPQIALLRALAASCRSLAPQLGHSLTEVTPLADEVTWSGTYPHRINDVIADWTVRLRLDEEALGALAAQAEAKAALLEAQELLP
ncbi:hypothetical protein GCM10022261_07540 [Brevibacterium daeguense]|uniref:Uncharacterized protein n=1 Tax=Brevibacterium daeguense TaxID=909936 RepID=A0ABP8EH48_9MICO|nr:hypothetical protein [Brevibacterium daeguense]